MIVELIFLGISTERGILAARVKKKKLLDLVTLSVLASENIHPTEISRKGWRASISVRDVRIRNNPSLDTKFNFISPHRNE